eukprot:CAMPEP_0179073696 /NCGR_PEP_ID=MMETSP0796-20121207/32705_1 /TAXON_ID=73915 /ORGANISM="Pyrodinium bahamense, Strain pbaha01" /LENGTH=215 /DNA_ID=CAMNT_0020770899 /DNA_START=28 /DNA_END=675 /DNA_ORIENTATION=-
MANGADFQLLRQWQAAAACRPSSEGDLEAGSKAVHWTEQARRMLLLLQLQRPYFGFCFVCAILAMAASTSTVVHLLDSHRRGLLQGRRWVDDLEGGTWQSVCWAVVSLALFAEVTSAAVTVKGNSSFSASERRWRNFDAAVVALTVFAWGLTRILHASPAREEAEVAEVADLWLLVLRFTLQPCRILAVARLACRVQQMQESDLDINFDALPLSL